MWQYGIIRISCLLYLVVVDQFSFLFTSLEQNIFRWVIFSYWFNTVEVTFMVSFSWQWVYFSFFYKLRKFWSVHYWQLCYSWVHWHAVKSIVFQVQWPLSLVISRKAITKYQLIFHFLFHCKHVNRQLCAAWQIHQVCCLISCIKYCLFLSYSVN